MRPSLEEVKEYFKDAEEIYTPWSQETFKTELLDYDSMHDIEGDIWVYFKDDKYNCVLWDSEPKHKGYATITKYKTTPTMKHYGNRPDVIDFNTKYDLNFNLGSAVKYLARAGKKQGETKQSDLKKALDFITRELEVIDPETVTAEAGLEVGRWYHSDNGDSLTFYDGTDVMYGFNGVGKWTNSWITNTDCTEYRPATDDEVKAALIKEAQRRYKVGDKVACLYSGKVKELRQFEDFKNFSNSNSELWSDGAMPANTQIFKDGKWARHA
jgi:hypothetical protein